MRVFMHMQANGNNLPGRSAISEMGGMDLADHTELVAFFADASRPMQPSANGARITGGLTQGPFSIVKTLDGISPMLAQALHQNQTVNANLLFFRTGQDGVSILAHTMTLLNARIVGQRYEYQLLADGPQSLVHERISIVAPNVRSTSNLNDAEFEWNTQPTA
ncbi:MAG: type VI secretion system tube protein Hcp [Pseudomonadota bacterium]